VYDFARSIERAMQHDYVVPPEPKWGDGPCLGSWNGSEVMQAAVPLTIKTSLEAGKAAELFMGPDYEGRSLGKTPVPFVTEDAPRVGAIIARAGIVTQFELWKEYASKSRYPYNRKQMEAWTFSDPKEQEILENVVNRRNELTHEISTHNDPTVRELVEYGYKLQWLAKVVARYG